MKKNRLAGAAIQAALIHLVLTALASVCVLDLGETATGCTLASIPFWIVVARRLRRADTEPTDREVALVSWGIIPVLIFGGAIIGAILLMFPLRAAR